MARGYKEAQNLLALRRGGGALKEHLAKTKQNWRSQAPRAAYQAPFLRASPIVGQAEATSGFKAAHRDRPVLVPVGRSSRGLPGKRRSGKPAQPRGPPALPMELRCTTDPPVKSGRRDYTP